MYQTVDLHDFLSAFQKHGRLDDGNKEFSVHGVVALFEYLTQAEADNGREFELDVIALCGQFAEYHCAIDALCDLQPGMVANFEEQLKTGEESPAELHDIIEDACRNYLRQNPFLIEFDGGVIVDKEW